ncbi:hypothetical protein MJO29_007144 [Puccinia striiformis f. sp. tritici]|nr:hypothetical protein MJO29_007144 [Puccinia striiformis f. sp. tritici]
MHLVARECADLAGQNSQKAHRHVKPKFRYRVIHKVYCWLLCIPHVRYDGICQLPQISFLLLKSLPRHFTASHSAATITNHRSVHSDKLAVFFDSRIFTIILERLWVERYQNSHTVNLKEINSVISLVELLVQLKLKDYSFVIYFLPLHNHQTRWFMVFVKSIQARCFLPNTLAM